MRHEREVVLIGLMALVLILALQNERVVITGHAVAEQTAGETTETEASTVASNVEAIKDIVEEEQKKDTFCSNECTPHGSTCKNTILSECRDFNFDGCLEFRQTSCMNGCDGTRCNPEPRPIKKSQSDIIKERSSILTDEACTGNIIGTVQWNPHGSLCRKAEQTTRSGGLFKPLDCCSKFYYEAECTQNLGIIHRGPLEYSQFFVIGCYDYER